MSVAASFKLGGGRQLPKLLFLTSFSRLAQKIGQSNLSDIQTAMIAASQKLVDIDGPSKIHSIPNTSDYVGVVILGGHDVLPSEFVDAGDGLKDVVRFSDDDSYYVWSDDWYADFGSTGLADLPVSRIPDAGDFSFMRACLTCSDGARPLGRAGLLNANRLYAPIIFQDILGSDSGQPLISGPVTPADYEPTDLSATNLYVVLHGGRTVQSYANGERPDETQLLAMNLASVHGAEAGVVLMGNCYGAAHFWTSPHAKDASATFFTPNTSMALSLLQGGARAIVGCTGSHYAFSTSELSLGSTVHYNFWQGIGKQLSPSRALFEAKRLKKQCIDPDFENLELKMFWQFTCLGLGW